MEEVLTILEKLNYPSVCLEGLSITSQHISQYSLSSGKDSDPKLLIMKRKF
jgi:hypothetical protein